MSSAATDEVVTHALVRDVLVPVPGHDPVRIALITLDNGQDHRRPTTFGPAGLAELDAALEDLAARDDLDAVAVTGKPFVFAVGADLSLLGGLRSREDVVEIGRLGHRTFARLADLGVPSFAFVNGPAMGGGLEVALHCTYRTIATTATVSLPEVSLGIIPGWGGAWLLPQLVGPDNAITVMVENPLAQNRQLDATGAVKLGVADVVLEPADFLTMSLRWAADVVRGRTAVNRPEVRRDAGAWSNAVTRGRAIADARVHSSAPAAYRAADLLEAAFTGIREEGFAAEDEALGDLLPSPQAQASLYAFDLVQRRARRPVGAPDPSHARRVTKVGVVGAGLMARQLALLTASRLGVPVVLLDKDRERLDEGLRVIGSEITMLTERGVFNADKANRLRALISGDVAWEIFADCDLVIEAVYEDLDTKREVFAALEKVVRDDVVLATNTSALSVTAMADGLAHPERVAGIHFFNPVAAMPLVELVRAPATDDAALATAFAFARGLGKSAVLCADSPGFVVNRVLTAFIDAAVSAVDEGTPPQAVEDAILAIGVPMGPFRLVELVGPQIALHVGEALAAAFPDRFSVGRALRTIVDAGLTELTVTEAGTTRIAPSLDALLTGAGEPLTGDQIRERALSAVALEVTTLLAEGVVSDPRDVDLCLLLGAGWPLHLGGITPELRRRGLLGT